MISVYGGFPRVVDSFRTISRKKNTAGETHPLVGPSLVDPDWITPGGQALARLAVPVDDPLMLHHMSAVGVDLGAARVEERRVLARDGGEVGRVEDVKRRHNHREQRAEASAA